MGTMVLDDGLLRWDVAGLLLCAEGGEDMKIWKYKMPITSEWVDFEVPGYGQVVHVEIQHGEPCFWMLCDPSSLPREKRAFAVFGTGHYIPRGTKHRGSFLAAGGAFVGHLMERISAL